MSNVQSITRKMIELAKQMHTLQDDELEKVLLNRSYLDRIYLMRRSKKTNIKLLERTTFKSLVLKDEFNTV